MRVTVAVRVQPAATGARLRLATELRSDVVYQSVISKIWKSVHELANVTLKLHSAEIWSKEPVVTSPAHC